MRKAYEEYKATGIQWLPKIPKHWEILKLRQILSSFSEKNHPDMPLLSVVREKGVIIRNTENTDKNHNYIPDDLTNYRLVKTGQFAMNKMKAWQGSYGVSDHDGIVSPAYFVFSFAIDIDKHFFNTAIRSKSYVSFFGQASDGIRVGQWDLSMARMKYIPFYVPPRDEQEQIVRFLDWKVSCINRLINLKQQEITQLKELKKATISDAVTHGLDKTVPMKDSGITWLGKIPQHWEMSFLSQVAAEKKVKKPRNAMFPVMSLSYGRIIKKKNINSGLVPNNYDNYQIISRGDIILRFTDLQNDHTSLRTGLVTEKGIITSAYTNIKPRTNSGFLAYLLHSYDELKIFYGLGGGVRQSIGFKDVRYLQLPIPPRDEQEKIACFLDARCAEIDRLIAANQAQITNLHDLKSSLIADVVTGQIDVRDVEIPDYEQVEETLYRSDANTTLQSEDEIPEEV